MHLRHNAWEKNGSVAQICILSGAGLQDQSLIVTHTDDGLCPIPEGDACAPLRAEVRMSAEAQMVLRRR